METWRKWLEAQQQGSNMQVQRVPLNSTPGWINKGDVVAKGDGAFFTVEGRKITRGPASWGQPIVVQVADPGDPEGRCGIVCLIFDEDDNILIQAEPEPGAAGPGHICLRAAIQTSHSRLASGKVPFKDILERRIHLGNAQTDPNRIAGTVEYALLNVDRDDIDLANMPAFRWFTPEEIAEAREAHAPFNGHFWAAYGMCCRGCD